jgi:hypothetical protein
VKRFARPAACALALGGGLLGFGPAVSPALAATFTMDLTTPATATVGKPVLIQASGVHPPPEEYWNGSWIELVAIPGSLASACPASDQDGVGVATSGGGDLLAIAQRPQLDAVGNYSNTFAWTPRAAGTWYLCGYQDDGAGLTLTRAGQAVTVQGAASQPTSTPAAPTPATAAKPANVSKPRVARSGRTLVCSPGRWSGTAGGYSYAWLVGGKPMSGATARKVQVTRATRGHRVRCSVTASNGSGSTTAVSPAVRVR